MSSISTGTFSHWLLTGVVTKFGYYNPWLFIGAIMVAVAGGVFTTWDLTTTTAMITGIQVLGGMGAACMIQMVGPFPISQTYSAQFKFPHQETSVNVSLPARHRTHVHNPAKRPAYRDLDLRILPILRRRRLPGYLIQHLQLASPLRAAHPRSLCRCSQSRRSRCSRVAKNSYC